MSKQGKSLSDDAIAMVRHVYDVCKKENSMKKRTVSVLHPDKRTSSYTGVALSTVSKYVYGKNSAHATSHKLHSVQSNISKLVRSRTLHKHTIRTLKQQLHKVEHTKRKLDSITRTRSHKLRNNSELQHTTEHIQQSITLVAQQSSPKRRKIVSLTNTTQQLQNKLVELKEQPAPPHGTQTSYF